MKSIRSSRRRFLAGLAGAFAGLAVGGLGGGRGARPRGALAAAYARIAPEEVSPSLLGARLEGRLGRAPERVGPAALARAIREDFDRGETLCVEGWILSRTECRFWLWRDLAA